MKRSRKERAAPPLPQFLFFDVSGEALRCFTPAPPFDHAGASCGTLQVTGLPALCRTRPSSGGLAAARRPGQAGESTACDHADPDTVSDAGTPAGAGDQSSEDDAVSFAEFFRDESFMRRIGALAELVGMKGDLEPAAVLGEVVRVLQEMERKRERFMRATTTV